MSPTSAEERANQRNALLAGFLGWTLDAFDFFVLTFVLAPIAKEFHLGVAEIALAITASLATRPIGAFPLRPARRSLRPPPSVDARHSFLFRGRGALRLRAQFQSPPDFAPSLRHRHGRRVGRGRIARSRIGAGKMARRSLRPAAGRLRARLSSRRRRLLDSLSALGMARAIFHRRRARAAHAFHSRQSKRKRRMARVALRAPRLERVLHGCSHQSPPLRLFGVADGHDEFYFAWHAGFLSHIPAAASRLSA